jgi:hypothetical protein
MDNDSEQNMFSNNEEIIRQIVAESIQQYLSNTNVHSSRPLRQQIIGIVRDIIRSGNSSLNNYNGVMHDFSRNMREAISLLQRITDFDNSSPIPPAPLPRSQPRSQPRRTPLTRPRQSRTPLTTTPLTRPRQSRTPFIRPQVNPTASLPDLNNIFSHILLPTINANNFTNMFENVRVCPTSAQIENASETIFYDDSLELLYNRCPITLASFQSSDRLRRILQCGHIFTEEPFMRWFQDNVQCPVCRFDIRTYNSSSEQPNTNHDNTEQDDIEHDNIEQDNIEHDNTEQDDIEHDNTEQDDIEHDNIEPMDIGYNNYTIPTGTTTSSYTFTDPSTMGTSSSVTYPTPMGNSLQSLLQTALSFDSSNNIVDNLSRYIISNIDSSNNINITEFMNTPSQVHSVDASNN